MASNERKRRSWRFGLRSLLVVTLLVACLLAGWRSYTNRSLHALAAGLGGDRQQATQLVFHPAFASSGLEERIRSSSSGLGRSFVHISAATEAESDGRPTIVYALHDYRPLVRGNAAKLIVVSLEKHGSLLTWIEVGGGPQDHWLEPEFVRREDAIMLDIHGTIDAARRLGQWRRTYRVGPSQIAFVGETRSPANTTADEDTRQIELRQWLSPAGPSVPGPESDLQ